MPAPRTQDSDTKGSHAPTSTALAVCPRVGSPTWLALHVVKDEGHVLVLKHDTVKLSFCLFCRGADVSALMINQLG
jgi:hypothetical protein